MLKHALIGSGALLLAACGAKETGEAPNPTPVGPVQESAQLSLPDVFDCARETGGVFIAAHRGGPQTGFPENTLETLQKSFDEGIRVFEIDISTSADGVLFLLHDDTLNRTTTGRGAANETPWLTISNLSTVDETGRVTRFNPPKLSDVLEWAVEAGAIVEIDKKRGTDWRDTLDVVRDANASNNVILITYDYAEAEAVHRLAPDLMMTFNIWHREPGGRRLSPNIDRDKVIAWTGTREPTLDVWDDLNRAGVEVAFGTLGRPGQRLDDEYFADGNPSEYSELIGDGLVLLATDRASDVANYIDVDDATIETCLSLN